jgi:hypothetical protein
MIRKRRARLGALAAGLLVLAPTLAGCVYQDPPAEAIATKRFTLLNGGQQRVFDLAPDGAEGDRFSGTVTMQAPGEDIAIKKVSWHVLDAAGAEIPVTDHRIHFHHAVAYSRKATDPVCGGSSHRWNAPGSERTELELPNGYAYFVSAADRWSVNIDLMNTSAERQNGIKLVYDITYTKDRSTLHDVTPYWLDASGCAGQFVLSGDRDPLIYSKERSFVLPKAGKVVAVRGHFHAAGIDATLTTADGRVICRTAGVYGEPGGGHDHGHGGEPTAPPERNLLAIPLCKDLSFDVRAGERVNVAVRYHNDVYMQDAMASMLVYVAEDEVEPAPTTVAPGGPTTLGGQAGKTAAGPVRLNPAD